MANRTFIDKSYSLVKGIVRLYPTVKMTAAVDAPILQKRTWSAAGSGSPYPTSAVAAAPTGSGGYAIGDGVGTRSVARTGAGAWTITLSDPYVYLIGISIIGFSSANGISTILGVGVVSGSTDVTTNTDTGNGGVIAIQLVDESGAADPGAVGDTFTFEIILGTLTEP